MYTLESLLEHCNNLNEEFNPISFRTADIAVLNQCRINNIKNISEDVLDSFMEYTTSEDEIVIRSIQSNIKRIHKIIANIFPNPKEILLTIINNPNTYIYSDLHSLHIRSNINLPQEITFSSEHHRNTLYKKLYFNIITLLFTTSHIDSDTYKKLLQTVCINLNKAIKPSELREIDYRLHWFRYLRFFPLETLNKQNYLFDYIQRHIRRTGSSDDNIYFFTSNKTKKLYELLSRHQISTLLNNPDSVEEIIIKAYQEESEIEEESSDTDPLSCDNYNPETYRSIVESMRTLADTPSASCVHFEMPTSPTMQHQEQGCCKIGLELEFWAKRLDGNIIDKHNIISEYYQNQYEVNNFLAEFKTKKDIRNFFRTVKAKAKEIKADVPDDLSFKTVGHQIDNHSAVFNGCHLHISLPTVQETKQFFDYLRSYNIIEKFKFENYPSVRSIMSHHIWGNLRNSYYQYKRKRRFKPVIFTNRNTIEIRLFDNEDILILSRADKIASLIIDSLRNFRERKQLEYWTSPIFDINSTEDLHKMHQVLLESLNTTPNKHKILPDSIMLPSKQKLKFFHTEQAIQEGEENRTKIYLERQY